MTRVGLKLLLFLELSPAFQRALATNSNRTVEPMPQSPASLVTNVAQLRSLSRADLNYGHPLSLTGTVTLLDTDRKRLALQDSTGALMWYSDKPLDPALSGKLIRIDCSNACTYAAVFPDFPFRPSGADIQTSFEAPSNWGDYHLTRMVALLHPPKSGEYTFWVASDDSSELWLSSDEAPNRVRKIASVNEGFWTSPREWDRFPSQRSESIYLRADKSYFIEAFQEQGLQDDHLSVAWEGPGIARSVIPGDCLTPWPARPPSTLADTRGVLREYWTNYPVGSVTVVSPGGPAGDAFTGPDVNFRVLGPATLPEPEIINLRDPLLPENNYRWIQTEGTVTFVSTDASGATLELAAGPRRVPVRIAKWNQTRHEVARNWHVQLQGVCEAGADIYGDLTTGFIWVPASENVRFLETVNDSSDAVAPAESPASPAAAFGGYYGARGVVTFDGRFAGRRYLYLQDIHGSVFVSDADRVLKYPVDVGRGIQAGGTLSPGKVGLQLVPFTARLLGWQSLPLPAEVSDVGAYSDGQWTEVEGVVRSSSTNGAFRLKSPAGFLSVCCLGMTVDSSLVDSTVRLRGVISLDSPEAPLLLVGARQFFQVEEQAPKDPFALPISRISDLVSGTPNLHRVKVKGTVTYANQTTVFLQDDSGALRLQLRDAPALHLGDGLEVLGFPDTNGSVCMLTEPDLHAAAVGPPLKPLNLALNNAVAKSTNGKLVQVRGTLLEQKSRGSLKVLELQSGQRAFQAVLPSNNAQLPPLTAGSLLELTGVCLADLLPAPSTKPALWENPSIATLQILLRAPTDIAVLRGPLWWTPARLVALVGFLLVVLGGTLLWVHLLRRRFARRQLAQLEFSRQILESQETERRRIATNLHDSLGQNLLVIKSRIRLAMQPALDKRAMCDRLDEISGMASQVIEEVRQITHDLRPYQLDRVGLTQTLRGTVRRVSENCPIVFASNVDDVDGLFDNDSEIHIYRILQEALNNVVKHSGATEATAVVRKEFNSVVLVVRDNGRGVNGELANSTELSRAGFGLSGIDERARILRGKALFDSRPGQGFRLTVEIPLPR